MNPCTTFSMAGQREVLIDTWWNVNYDKNGAYFTFGRVLIDTWWNVNIPSPNPARLIMLF